MTENPSHKTRVRVFEQWILRGERNAILELRGRMLLLASVDRYSVLTQAFDTTGATYQKKQIGFGAILLWWFGLAAALYVLYLFFYALFVSHAIPAIVVTGATGLVAARCLIARNRIQRAPATQIRLNATGTVYNLTIAHTPGENPALDAILAKMRPFEQSFHRYKPCKYACLATDCLMAFPARYIATHGAVALGWFFMTAFAFAAAILANTHDLGTFRVTAELFKAFAAGCLGLLYILRAVWMYRMKRKVPKIQVALRSALGYLRAGEFERAETVLQEAKGAYPEDETLVALSAQIAVLCGRYEDAERYLKTQSTSQESNLAQLDTVRELLQEG